MPHLKTLVERYEGRPFSVIGVNAYDSEDDYRDGVKNFKVTWISAFQGVNPVISELFRVEGYPTYLLIDHEGKIVQREHHHDGDSIEQLVKVAEAAGK